MGFFFLENNKLLKHYDKDCIESHMQYLQIVCNKTTNEELCLIRKSYTIEKNLKNDFLYIKKFICRERIKTPFVIVLV